MPKHPLAIGARVKLTEDDKHDAVRGQGVNRFILSFRDSQMSGSSSYLMQQNQYG